ncbi:hypothetical protein Ancab_034513 [Ancistrocladus abbreviatus]
MWGKWVAEFREPNRGHSHSKGCVPKDTWKKIENHTGKQQDGKHEIKFNRIVVSIEASTPISPSKKPQVEITDVVELNDGGAPEDEDYLLNFLFDVNELIDAIDVSLVCELGCEEVGVPLSGQGDILPHMQYDDFLYQVLYPDAKQAALYNVDNDLGEDFILRIDELGFIDWTKFGL